MVTDMTDTTCHTVFDVIAIILCFIGFYVLPPSEQFTVVGPVEPIVVKLNEDALLQCHLFPTVSAEHMEVSWVRSNFDAVYVYRDGKVQDEEQVVKYRGRTELLKDAIAEGNVTLRIQNVRLSDSGQYWCRFRENYEYGEAKSEVIVTSLGTHPHIRMEGPVNKKIKLVCISRGWFPEPQTKWRYFKGEELPSKIQILFIDGLFHVEMSLWISEDSSVRNVSCSIYNPILFEEKVSYIYIPEKLDEEFALKKVIGPTKPLITSLSEDVLLPCHLFLEMDAQNMEVDWILSQFSNTIYMHQDGKDQDQEQEQMAEHSTVFTKDTITNGRIVFKIRNIRISDDCQYQRYFQKNQGFQRAIVVTRIRNRKSSTELWILVVLLICFIVRNYQKKEREDTGNSHVYQIQVIRESLAKEMESLVKERESLTKERESLHMDRESLANERQSLAMERKSLCTLRESLNKENLASGHEEEKDSEYLRKSEFLTKERERPTEEIASYKKEILTIERECLNKKVLPKEEAKGESLVKDRESLNTEIGKGEQFFTPKEEILGKEKKLQVALQEEIERRKALYRADWRKANLYGDWRKEQFQALHVTLDPDTAHPELILSEEWRCVIRGESPQNVSDTTKRFDYLPCVLGREKITSGRHYWELQVETRTDWDLGVCRDDVRKKGIVTVAPENGFWALRLYNDEYWALTSPPTHLSLRQSPHKVAVFLDYDAGDVSFYNMNDGSHIYNFTSVSFCGTLCPFIRLWSYDQVPVTICTEP